MLDEVAWDSAPFQLRLGNDPLPLTQLWEMLGLTAAMLLVTVGLSFCMRFRSGGFRWARVLATGNNAFYGTVVCMILVMTSSLALQRQQRIAPGWDTVWCKSSADGVAAASDELSQWLMYAFYLSKLWEFLDIVLVLLSGGSVALGFAFHHLTTLSVVWLSVWAGMGSNVATCTANAFHHIGMYFYFAGFPKLKQVLLMTGTLQLALGLLGITGALYRRYAVGAPCSGTKEVELFLLATYAIYAIFWVGDLATAYNTAKQEEAEEEEKKAE